MSKSWVVAPMCCCPGFALGRRLDAVAVIWATLLARAMGAGWRRITAAAGRPASTVGLAVPIRL